MSERLNTGQQKIPGYRDLSADELQLITHIKTEGLEVMELVDMVNKLQTDSLLQSAERARWAAIAKTQLQQGFMALTRAVALPGGF